MTILQVISCPDALHQQSIDVQTFIPVNCWVNLLLHNSSFPVKLFQLSFMHSSAYNSCMLCAIAADLASCNAVGAWQCRGLDAAGQLPLPAGAVQCSHQPLEAGSPAADPYQGSWRRCPLTGYTLVARTGQPQAAIPSTQGDVDT